VRHGGNDGANFEYGFGCNDGVRRREGNDG